MRRGGEGKKRESDLPREAFSCLILTDPLSRHRTSISQVGTHIQKHSLPNLLKAATGRDPDGLSSTQALRVGRRAHPRHLLQPRGRLLPRAQRPLPQRPTPRLRY